MEQIKIKLEIFFILLTAAPVFTNLKKKNHLNWRWNKSKYKEKKWLAIFLRLPAAAVAAFTNC